MDTPSICILGKYARIARLRDEHYDFIECPSAYIERIKSTREIRADLLTFVPPIAQRGTLLPYHVEMDSAAVLNVSTYDNWWKKQINDKTRNMVRKSGKTGVEIRHVDFSDELVDGIKKIYDETPFRQGRRFRHFGKPIHALREEHGTFLHRSEFVGAFFGGSLIGFIKLVHGQGSSNLMQIISMVSHRDKAPTNALIAKAVEICASKEIPLLHYGTWSRRSMGDFKKHHGFARVDIPRYFVPLTAKGVVLLKCGMHRRLAERIPESWLDRLALLRAKWNSVRYRRRRVGGAVAQLAERHS